MLGQIILFSLIAVAVAIVLSLLLLFHVHKQFLGIFAQIDAFGRRISVMETTISQIDKLKEVVAEIDVKNKQVLTEIDMQADTIKRLQNRAAADKRHKKNEEQEAAMQELALQMPEQNQLQFPSGPQQAPRRAFGEMP